MKNRKRKKTKIEFFALFTDVAKADVIMSFWKYCLGLNIDELRQSSNVKMIHYQSSIIEFL